MALTKNDLDHLRCADPACTAPHGTPLHLTAVCHPGRGLTVSYHQGILGIRCKKCQKKVADIEVALFSTNPKDLFL